MFDPDVIKKSQSLVFKYIEHMKKSLSEQNVTTKDQILTEDSTSKVISKLFKDGEYKGKMTRKFQPLGVELTQIELEGKTGLLDPIYAAEKRFFQENQLPVKTNLVNTITERKFHQHYEGAVNWGHTTMWRPKPTNDFFDIPLQHNPTKVINRAEPILDALKSTPGKDLKAVTSGALKTAFDIAKKVK